MRRQALVIQHAFDSDMAKAKDLEARQVIASERYHESSEYWGALAEFRTNQLLDRARKLYLVPDGMQWITDGYANRSSLWIRRELLQARLKLGLGGAFLESSATIKNPEHKS
jgi:hypothetical protein